TEALNQTPLSTEKPLFFRFLDLIAWPIFSTTATERSTPKCLKILISNIDFFISTELHLHKGKPLLLLRSEKLGAVATQTAGDDWCGHGFKWESLWKVETEGEEKESSRNFAGRKRKVQIFSGLRYELLGHRLMRQHEKGKRSLDPFFVEETRSDTTYCPVDEPRGGEWVFKN
ncbi:hypothetical protein Taro_048759, partial [Colocasia esculenta]|nr:hypothetical protein [Colocasia esculenta]